MSIPVCTSVFLFNHFPMEGVRTSMYICFPFQSFSNGRCQYQYVHLFFLSIIFQWKVSVPACTSVFLFNHFSMECVRTSMYICFPFLYVLLLTVYFCMFPGDQVAMYNELSYKTSVCDVAFHPHEHMVAFCSFSDNSPILVYKYDHKGRILWYDHKGMISLQRLIDQLLNGRDLTHKVTVGFLHTIKENCDSLLMKVPSLFLVLNIII